MKSCWVGGMILVFMLAGASRADIGDYMVPAKNLIRVANSLGTSDKVSDSATEMQAGMVTDPQSGLDLFGSNSSSLYGWDGHGILYALDHPAQEDGSQLAGSLGVSSASDHLFFMDGGALYQMDTRTGTATVVGPSLGASNLGPHTPAVLPSLPVMGPDGSDAASLVVNLGAATSDPPTVGAGFAPAGSDPDPAGIGFAPAPDPPSVVPEPRSLSLLGALLLGIAWTARQKRHAD